MDSLPNDKIYCHLTGFTKKCRKLVTDGKCDRWLQIQGHDPNTGDPVNRWNCIDNWGPMLAIENSLMQRRTGAAVESFRNEFVERSETMARMTSGENLRLAVGAMKEINNSDSPVLEHQDADHDKQS